MGGCASYVRLLAFVWALKSKVSDNFSKVFLGDQVSGGFFICRGSFAYQVREKAPKFFYSIAFR